jgi:DNA uptake protein ComE-like DNA-binding protein
MGSSNSCLPISFNTLCCRSSITKVKHNPDQQPIESINKNNNKININSVPEDELLFLPGITRQLAQNIVQHREMNNGFKQINEILKVGGISYDLFQSLCFDISVDSSSSLSNTKEERINLNLASYNDLCLIPGLTPNLITQIIQYRKRKGLFRFVEDLLQIKDIDYVVLATVRPYVTVDNSQIPTLLNSATDSPSLAALLLNTLPPEFQTRLLSSFSQRPSVINEIKQKIFRFASWNLQQLTNDKVQNPGVKEVICRVILENKYEEENDCFLHN